MRYEDTARSNATPVKTVVRVVFLLGALLNGSLLGGAEPAKPLVPVTQVWMVNTRCAPGCGDLEAGMAQITYSRLDESSGCGQWQASDAASLQASAMPGVPTTILIHGNGSDEEWAVRHGNEVYRLMKEQACGRPFRLIVWSWPADRVARRPRPDVQTKACRSDVEAYYLARFLPTLPKEMPLGVIGYSLGCRTISGALELLAGGSVSGRCLSADAVTSWQNARPRHIRVMMLAAAMDADWLEPGCPRGQAPLAVERIMVAQNDCDRVLKWYSHLYGRGGPEALGYAGPAGSAGGKIELVDVSCEVGKKHDFQGYIESPSAYQRLAWYTFLCDSPPEKVTATFCRNGPPGASHKR